MERHKKGVNRQTVLLPGLERDGCGNDSSYKKLQIVQEKDWQGLILSKYPWSLGERNFAPSGATKGSCYIAHFEADMQK